MANSKPKRMVRVNRGAEGPKRSMKRTTKAPTKASGSGKGGGQVPASRPGGTSSNKKAGFVSYTEKKGKRQTTTFVTKDGRTYKKTNVKTPKRRYGVGSMKRVK